MSSELQQTQIISAQTAWKWIFIKTNEVNIPWALWREMSMRLKPLLA